MTHQISPYLTVAALVTLVVFRLLRPWWLPVVVLVPAIGFAMLNGDVLGKFLSLAAVGKVLDNVQPPSHDMTVLPKPLVTRLAFDVPAVALIVLGLVAVLTVLMRRDRVHWGLLAAAASPISLLVATNYGQEGIFRVVLFATPWIAILAAGLPRPSGRFAWAGALLERTFRPAAVTAVFAATAVAAMVAVGAFGQTALDWNRVPPRSQSAATQFYDATAPKGSVMLLTGSANAVPSNTGSRYFDVGWLSREVLGDYPGPRGYDAVDDVSEMTRSLVLEWPATQYYAMVAEPFGAYDERYGVPDRGRLPAAPGSHGRLAVLEACVGLRHHDGLPDHPGGPRACRGLTVGGPGGRGASVPRPPRRSSRWWRSPPRPSTRRVLRPRHRRRPAVPRAVVRRCPARPVSTAAPVVSSPWWRTPTTTCCSPAANSVRTSTRASASAPWSSPLATPASPPGTGRRVRTG
ncbi:hypothetical protein Q9Q99_05400 [Curtobacterium flaccumfaciens]|nr:hypothetical protein Q9Q99_05400 [Curtobacterium flaccumfaciens]